MAAVGGSTAAGSPGLGGAGGAPAGGSPSAQRVMFALDTVHGDLRLVRISGNFGVIFAVMLLAVIAYWRRECRRYLTR